MGGVFKGGKNYYGVNGSLGEGRCVESER